MSEFMQFVDLASERLGGCVVVANDEFFAPKESLLQHAKPVFIEGKYTDRGKWMDGWETRRRRTPGAIGASCGWGYREFCEAWWWTRAFLREIIRRGFLWKDAIWTDRRHIATK